MRRTTETVPIKRIVQSRLYTRSLPSEEEFKEFTASVEATGGPIQPPIVRPVARGDKLEIVCGFVRWQAALRAKQKTLTVIVRRLTDAEALELMATENLHRFEPNAVETAETLWRLARELAARGGATIQYLSERKAAELLAPRLKMNPDTLRGKLGMLPADADNVERLRAAGATFEHCRRARQLMSQTEIADADQEKWWVDLAVEAMKKKWSVKEMWRNGQDRYRFRKQRVLYPALAPKPWEPPKRKYDFCETCGQPWGAHLCPFKAFHKPSPSARGGATPQGPATLPARRE